MRISNSIKNSFYAIGLAAVLWGIAGTWAQAELETYDPAFEATFGALAKTEVIAEGFTWAEGPSWHAGTQTLYFTDVPESKLYAWRAGAGLSVVLDPSGLAKSTDGFREAGLNGTLVLNTGKMLAANHGLRRVELIDLKTFVRAPVAVHFEGKKFNSPNDIALADDGSLYFTDPPYGLAGIDQSPLKEQPHNGVYSVSEAGEVSLVDGSLTKPNGIGLSPDGKHLYVAVSDPDEPVLYRYSKQADGQFAARQIMLDMIDFRASGGIGLPDGLSVAPTGHIFATGPGGIFVLSGAGKLIARIHLDRPAANCLFVAQSNTLFITAKDRVLKLTFAGAPS